MLGERIASQSEVIRATVLEDRPCYVVPIHQNATGSRSVHCAALIEHLSSSSLLLLVCFTAFHDWNYWNLSLLEHKSAQRPYCAHKVSSTHVP